MMGQSAPPLPLKTMNYRDPFCGTCFDLTAQTISVPMETTLATATQLLNSLQEERLDAAQELQNEISQLLASVLLWLRIAKSENRINDDPSIRNAETNLNDAIDRVRALHYRLSTNQGYPRSECLLHKCVNIIMFSVNYITRFS
jgi:hypothetical protein